MKLSRMALILMGLFLAREALAYLPSARGLLRRVAQKHETAPHFQVSGKITVTDEAHPNGQEGTASFSVKNPEKCEAKFNFGPDQTFVATVDHGKIDASQGELTPSLRAWLHQSCILLSIHGIGARPETPFIDALSPLGIKLQPVSLDRLDKTIAYVIGAPPRNTDRPQVWIDKQSLAMIRLITNDQNEHHDLRLYPPNKTINHLEIPGKWILFSKELERVRFIVEQ